MHTSQPPGQVTPWSCVGATRCPWPDLAHCSSPAPPRGTCGPHPLCLPRKLGMDECTGSVEQKMDRDWKPTVGRGHPLGPRSPNPSRSPQANSGPRRQGPPAGLGGQQQGHSPHVCFHDSYKMQWPSRGRLGEAVPSGSTHWSRDPCGHQNPRTLKSLLYNDAAFACEGSLKRL